MPRPIYIICCHDIIEGKNDNLVTIVKIVERISILKRQPIKEGEPIQIPPINILRAVAVWKKEEGDDDREFEGEMAVLAGEKEIGRAASNFRFTPGKILYRFNLEFPVFSLSTNDGGWIEIQSRVRPVGETEWLTQSYPFICEVEESSESLSTSDRSTNDQ